MSEWAGTGDAEFVFSLNSMSLVEVVKANGEVILGYFRRLNRNDACIRVSMHLSNKELSSKIGSKTLHSIKKYSVDRLGRLTSIEREQRTWRGKVCM